MGLIQARGRETESYPEARHPAEKAGPWEVHAAHANAVREYLALFNAGAKEHADWQRMRDHARAAVAANCVEATHGFVSAS